MIPHPEPLPIRSPESVKASAPVPPLDCDRIDLDPDTSSRLVFLSDPNGLPVERYRLLRRQLCGANPQGATILVTSPSPGDGKTLTAVNLAFCLAEAGFATCIADFDLRSPSLCRELQYDPGEMNVSAVLHGKATLSEAIRRVGDGKLHILGTPRTSNPESPHFHADSLRPLLYKLRSHFTWVILDTVPAMPFSDVPELLPEVDGALMVVRSGQTRKSLLEPTIAILGNKLCGVVLNDAVVRGGSYYGYYERSSQPSRKAQRKEQGKYTAIRGISLSG